MDRALERLRDADDPALGDLAVLVADHVAARRLDEVLDSARLASAAADALRALAADDEARRRLVTRLEAERADLKATREPLRTWAVAELDATIRELLAVPVVPSEELTYRVINHEALRAMLREVLQGTLTRFVDGVRSIDKGVLGGLGSKVASRGRGLLGGVGAAAEGLMGAVRDEVGARFDTSIRDSLGHATDEAVRAIARWVADPAHADTLARMRVSVFDVLLDVPVGDLVGEADAVDLDAISRTVWRGLQAAAARPDLEGVIHDAIAQARERRGDDTLGAWIDTLGLRDRWRDAARDLAADELRALVATPAFEAWWAALHA